MTTDTPTTPDALPEPVPGADLAAERKKVGIAQTDLADRLGLHRTNLNRWEESPEVDGIRAAKYKKALRELAAEALA